MSLALPEGFDEWSLEEKNAFIRSLKYNWDYWARPEQKLPDLKDPWKVWMILSGRGWGKAYAYGTQIPTPKGMRNIEDLNPGDSVFDSQGHPVCIATKSPTWLEPVSYLVKFTDGFEVVTCGEHDWVLLNRGEVKRFGRGANWLHPERTQGKPKYSVSDIRRVFAETGTYKRTAEVLGIPYFAVYDVIHNSVPDPGPKVYTSRELSGMSLVHDDGHKRFAVPLLQTATAPSVSDDCLPIDPYLLGVWLGDGTHRTGAITVSQDDSQYLIGYCEESGLEVHSKTIHKGNEQFRATISVDIPAFRTALRRTGLHRLDRKMIPEEYFLASEQARRALLAGLIDTDGTRADSLTGVTFTNTDPHLHEYFIRLMGSVGERPMKTVWNDNYAPSGKLNAKQLGRTTATLLRPLPTRVKRKTPDFGRVSHSYRTGLMTRTLESVTAIPGVPTVCVTVEDTDHLILVGSHHAICRQTRTGAEAIKKLMLDNPGCRIGIIGMTAGAVRDTCYEGESGLLSVLPPDTYDRQNGGKYNRSLGQLTLSNGSMAFSFSGSDPEKLRGFQSNFLWMDELCAFSYSQEAWDMAMMGLRLGAHPRIIITTTPKPSPLIVELVRRGNEEPDNVILTSGSTFDNAANLPESTLQELRNRYEGTTMGRQELYAELILDDPGALWKRDLIDETRVSVHDFDLTKMVRIIVAIDPSMSVMTERESETGMIVAGLGANGHAYIIEDCSALRPSPDMWANLAISKYHQYAANRIVAEVNQGYDLVDNLLKTKDDRVPVKKVYATRGGKFLRAEPVAALYEQKRVHHVGLHGKLEDQMTQWVPGKASPDRLDAMVWAITDLMLGGGIAELFNPNSLGRLPGILKSR